MGGATILKYRIEGMVIFEQMSGVTIIGIRREPVGGPNQELFIDRVYRNVFPVPVLFGDIRLHPAMTPPCSGRPIVQGTQLKPCWDPSISCQCDEQYRLVITIAYARVQCLVRPFRVSALWNGWVLDVRDLPLVYVVEDVIRRSVGYPLSKRKGS